MSKSLICIFLFFSTCSYSQDSTIRLGNALQEKHSLKPVADSEIVKLLSGKITDITVVPSKRKWIIGGGTAAIYGTSFIYLNEAWYKGYPRSSFHTFNDFGEWKQMDKIGHAWSAYNIGRATASLWQWAGVSKRKS